MDSDFRKGHSTYDGLVRHENDIRESFIRDEYVIAVFLDIEKAFDSIWHHGLLRKIYEHGLHGHPIFFQEQEFFFFFLPQLPAVAAASNSAAANLRLNTQLANARWRLSCHTIVDSISDLSSAC